MIPLINPVTLFFASVLTSNILLTNFLGMCSFISISKDWKSSFGLGMAVTFVLTITTAVSWLVLKYLLVPLQLEYLSFIVFIIVIAAVVQILEMVIDRASPALYLSLGIFLPLITVNCAILGAILFMQIRNYGFLQSVSFGAGSGLGWWLAILLLGGHTRTHREEPRARRAQGPRHYHHNHRLHGHGFHRLFRHDSRTVGGEP
jgi:Na+-transporting NADH:ubiquinone oxidoreductase subunit E